MKMQYLKILSYILIFLLCNAEAARILGVFPIPSRSHQIVFQSYVKELAKRGHELVIITPIPSNDTSEHITEIEVDFSHDALMRMYKEYTAYLKRGVIMDIDSLLGYDFYRIFLKTVAGQFKSEQVQKLFNDKTQKFDLIVVEGFYEYQLIVSEIFKAPVIMFPSFMGFPEHYEMMGAIGRHPILYPHFHRNKYVNLNFLETAKELYYEYKLYQVFKNVEETQDMLLKEDFGPDAPTTKELKNNVDLLFLNSYHMFANNRPIPPNVKYLGATHLKPAKEIPQNLKTYLDESARGVIFVSFGSNIRPSLMEKDFLEALLKAFADLPFDILWRYDGESVENVPMNVKWQHWFPQRDMLFHPNIKAFVTQCGLQSTDEAIDSAVPLIGVPMMAEQWYNAQKYVDFGIGVKLDSMTLTAEDLVKGVMTVVENKSYKKNIEHLRTILYDQPQTPLEKAMWWTEYVIRHGGAKHLRSPVADMSWTEFYMMDFVLPVIGALILVLTVALLILRGLYRMVKGLFRSEKIKRS